MKKSLGEFEQLVLFAVLELEDEAYGASIGREIERRTGREVAAGAIYTALERLAARGLVTGEIGGPTPERGGRRRKFYRLEPEGAVLLRRAVEEFRTMSEGLLPKLEALVEGDSR